MDTFEIHQAAEVGDLERVRQLIEGGVSVDSRDDLRQTPLHWAAKRGRYDVVDFLVSLPECDLNLKDSAGWTPVWLAAGSGKNDIVDLLLRHGAKVNCADGITWTLLHHASCKGWTDTVHHILGREDADLNAATSRGNTPLMVAVFHEQVEVAALLVRAGADVNQRNARKLTALHEAALHGHTRVVRVLLHEQGLELNPQDEDGDTPLHWACLKGNLGVVKQLMFAGADATLKNNNGETALTKLLVKGMRGINFTPDFVRFLARHGGFLQDPDYAQISQNPFLKENVLKDVGLCTQLIVNKFHLQSLPALSSITYFARKLPHVDKFKLSARQIEEVEDLVKGEIERKGFCNVVQARPMALSALCVLSLITCQSGTKRSASPDFGDSNSPFKKLHS